MTGAVGKDMAAFLNLYEEELAYQLGNNASGSAEPAEALRQLPEWAQAYHQQHYLLDANFTRQVKQLDEMY